MNEHKQSKFIIDVSASAKWPNRSTTRFFSYDSHTAEIVIQAEKDGKLIDQTLVDTVDIYFESVNMKYRPIDGLKWNDTMDISTDGLYSYILPDDFLNYEGLVAFDVYINYKNGDKADSSNRIIFEQRVSAIDRNAGQVELVYIKDMEAAKQAVADKADEVKANMSGYESSLADYEHQIKNGMDLLYDGVANASADEITKIRAELPKVETDANDEITKIQAVLPDVQATAADETAKIKAQLPIVEAVAIAETEKIQAELPKVASVTTDEISKIKAELPIVQTVATEEIGKIHSVLPTVEQTAQEVSDHADQKIAEYDAKFVSTDQKMAELEQSQVALDAELKATQQQIIDADVYTKAEADANAEGILDKRNLSPAWSWSADGTDRFTTVYPGENILINSKDYSSKWAFINAALTEILEADGTPTKIIKLNYNPNGWVGAYQTAPNWYARPATGETVTLSFYARGNGKIYATIDGLTGAINVTATDAWKLYKLSGVATKDVGNVAIYLHSALTTATSIYIHSVKFEINGEPTIYTPAPSEDPLNAYPKYKGLRLAPSDNPADYDWSYTDEYVDYLKSSSVSKTEFNDLASRLTALENKEV